MKALFVSSRSCTVLLDPEGEYLARRKRHLFLNGESLWEEERSVTSLFGLEPEREYTLECRIGGTETETLNFRTEPEVCTMNVRDFGAKGDGETEDTAMLQAAILSCPAGGRVLIPAGTYLTGPLFLKSHLTLELAKGATLSLLTDRNRFPILPGKTPARTEQGNLLLGLWEGTAEDGYASALTGIDLEDVCVIGEGIVDGRADQGDWWVNPKVRRGAWRGYLLHLMRCSRVTVQGITFRNSPSWNLHPAFSDTLDFLNIRIQAPYHSPNTDGFDPESCRDVRLLGTEISVGDDCIAIKSGKIQLGSTYKTPCRNLEIAWCAMLDGHGGVTVGSEMAGGVRDVRVHHCYMRGNDRGLRVKTRRDRGKDGVIDRIVFEQVTMDGVRVPLVVNSMYFCDADGHSPRVQSREKQLVDETTPKIGTVCFERVRAMKCKTCAGYVLGLPEQPVEHLMLKDCEIDFEPGAEPFQPAMADGVDPCSGRGLIAKFVKKLTLENVTMTGYRGERLDLEAVETLEQK